MTLKRFIVSLCIVFIFSITFIGGYTRATNIVYADSTTDQWTQVTTNEQLVEAFRYYCKSRDITFNGGVADAITHFTTQTFNGLCNTLGINVTALQAHLKYQTDSNIGLRYLFDSEGISLYNRIFSQFLQDNDLEVGDKVDDKLLKSGTWFEDDNGNGCWVYVLNNDNWWFVNSTNVSEFGSMYRLSTNDARSIINSNGNNVPFTINVNGVTYNNVISVNNYAYTFVTGTTPTTGSAPLGPFNSNSNGWLVIVTNASKTQYALAGAYSNDATFDGTNIYSSGIGYIFNAVSDDNTKSTNIYITTNNNVINNNTYEGDTIINNNGTTGDDDSPGGGGDQPGGGGNTTTPPTNTGGGSGEDDGTITFPDFDFHLPEINWSLGDLSEKFPFSIPFDLIAFFTVLNAEPQAPAIDADIPLGSWYTWHFEADFSQFDNYAVIIRNVEFIGFCVGLIYLTIKLVKG